MKGRGTETCIVFSFYALLIGVSFLVGCGTSTKAPERQWTPIAHSADVIVSTNTETGRHTPPQPLSNQHLALSTRGLNSPFQAYDRALVDSIEQRWYDILDHGSFPMANGEVVLQFALTWKGNVSELKVTTNTANEQLAGICVKAVRDSAPYPPWSPEMRKMVGDKRLITLDRKSVV